MANNLELALRVRADVAQAVSQLNSLNGNINQIGQTGNQAQSQLGNATNQSTTAINRQAQALENVSDSLDLNGEIRQTQRLGQAMDDTAQATQNTVNINERMEQSLRSLTPHFMSLIGLSGGLLTASLNALEKSAQLKNLSNISGMNVEQFQYFAVGAKTVGIEMDKLSDIFKDTRDKVGDFLTTGGGELQDFFENIAPQVGVTAEQFRYLSGADALQLYVNSLREANVSENEMIFYMESIADEASALLPLLNEGGEGFRRYGEQARQAGAILSQATVNDALKAKSAISEFSNEMQGVGNRIVVNLIPALQFVSQHLDALVKAGIVVASVFAGRMTASLVATTVAFIAGQAEAIRYQMALARMADVSALTATRLNALTMASRMLTASGGLIGLGVAVASIVAGFLLMRKSSDEVSTSLIGQRKSVAELKSEYDKLSETQKRVKTAEQLDKIDELTKAYNKQAYALTSLTVEATDFWKASASQREQIFALSTAFNKGQISAEQLANEFQKMGFVSDELKRKIDEQAIATTNAKSELDNANNVLSIYQGKTISATSATSRLSSGLDNVGKSAEKTTAKIGELSKQYKNLMEQTEKDIFELEMTNALIQKHGYEPERASAIAKARSAKGSDLTKDDIALIDRHLSAQNKYAELTKKDEKQKSTSSGSSSAGRTNTKSTAPRVVGIVGDTGIGRTHLDIRRADGKKPTQSDLDRFRAGGKKLTDYRMTSGYGWRDINIKGASKFHKGLDFAIAKGTEITTTVPVKDVKKWWNEAGGGWVSNVIFEDGLVMKLLHQDPSMRQKVKTGASGGSSSPTKYTTSSTKSDKPKYTYSQADIKAMQKVRTLVRSSELVDVAKQYGVPIEKVEALMMQESRGERFAKSHTGALGYFQTTSGFRKQWGLTEKDSYDIVKSGTATIKSLAQAFKEFGNWDDAILSHNAGLGGTRQFKRTGKVTGSSARNKEVREYTGRVNKWGHWFGDKTTQSNDETGQAYLDFIQAELDHQKQEQEKAKELAEKARQQAEKRAELVYEFASDPVKFKTDYDKKVSEIKSAGFAPEEETELLKKAEQEYQDKLTKRPEILERALGAVKQLEQDFLGATVSEHEKTLYDIEHKYDELLKDITALKNLTTDPVQVKELNDAEHKIRLIIDKEKLKAEYDNAMTELDKLQAEKQQKIDILQSRYDNSNMTAHEFHTQKQAIDTEINPQLQTLATTAQLLAQSLGDAFSVEKLNLFIAGLSQADTTFQQFLPTTEQLNDRITNGLTDAFFAFADGTKSAEQAFREFASAFFREIAQMILKQMIFNAISTAGKAGGGGWGGAVAGVIGSAFGGKGYSSGGYTGKGGKYEPAGIVHRDEFVIRKEMTNQVGAKEFLANFNRYGMNAIKGLQGYSSGGLVGASVPQISAPNIQAPKLSSPSEKIAQSTSLNNQQNFYLVDDPSRILDTLNSSQGQENLVVMMSRDPEKFKTALRL